MITILLKQIIDLLTGWISSFTQYASDVLEKLGLIEEDTSNLPDIKSNTDDIKDNTASVITPINNIKSNTDSIVTSSGTTASNTTVIANNINTISTNTGTAAAFAEDCANNTLDIKDKVTTIASDTTQIRSNTNTVVTDLSDIKDLMQYYFLTNIVTEDASGDICSFDTDLEDYLQKAICTIPADGSGFSSIDIYKKGINFLPNLKYQRTVNHVVVGQNNATYFEIDLPEGYYTFNVELAEGVSASLYITGETEAQRSLGNTYPNTFSVTKHEKYRFQLYSSNGLAVTDIIRFQLENGNSFTNFDTFKGTANPVSLGSTITDGAEIDLLSGIVKINTSPVTYSSITPIAIRTYKGVNNIYSDSGSMDVTYRESLKHYLDKNNQ